MPFFAVTKSTESNMRINYLLTPLLLFATVALAQTGDEKHLTNIKQLTFGGDNAEAYFSFDSKYVSFQSNNPKWGLQCDQIFYLDVTKGLKNPDERPQFISTGKGRTTCSYFMPDGKHILFGHRCSVRHR